MSPMRRFRRDARGATAVEFAMVAPLLIAAIIFIIEGSRFLWTKQAIQEAASLSARCVAIGSQGCDTPTNARVFARERAAKMGIAAPAESFTVSTNQTCHGVADMNKVAVDVPFNSPVGSLLPVFPARVKAEACFPSLR